MDIGIVVDHVAELVAAFGLLLLCLATGRFLLPAECLKLDDRPLAALVFAVILGMGGIGAALLLLGLIGPLSPVSIGILMLASGFLVRSQLVEGSRLLARCWRFASERWDRAVLVVLGLIGLCLLIQTSAPPTDWDALIYHLESPRAWLSEGRIHLPPDNLHAAFTGLVHMLYLPLLSIDAPSATAVLNAVLAVLLAVLLFEFGDRFFDRTTGRIAAITLFGSPAVLFVAMTPRVDVTLALFLVASLYALFAALFDNRGTLDGKGTEILLAALVLGLATGVKLIALPWVLSVLPLVVWGTVRCSTTRDEGAKLLMLAAAAFLVGAAPWMIFRWKLVGAPLYPALAARHVEPWLQPWYGTEWLGDEAYTLYEAAPRYTSEVFSLDALLFRPSILTPEPEGAFYFPALLLWILPFALLRPRDLRLWLLILVGAVFVPLLPALLERGGRTNLRFLIAALPVLTLAAARLLVWSFRITRAGTASRVVVGTIVLLTLVPASFPFVFRWSRMPVIGHFAGLVSQTEYLRDNEDPDVYLWARTVESVNQRLSEDDRLLLIFEGRGFRLKRPKLQDNLMANWPLLQEVREPNDCLERAGVTHVLVNFGVLVVHLQHGMPPSAVAWGSFDEFARECLERQAVIPPYALYQVFGGTDGGTGTSRTATEWDVP